MDFTQTYRFHPGFAFRREGFGGILYHYEGIKPDPRISFIDSPFLIDLLERVDCGPLEALIDAVAGRFALAEADVATIREFFTTLHTRGALVVQQPMPQQPIPAHA
ncbi:MAG TPA: mycofactocin biosynthesis chaperone MftB [bacterium]